jgi:hypothetical protein
VPKKTVLRIRTYSFRIRGPLILTFGFRSGSYLDIHVAIEKKCCQIGSILLKLIKYCTFCEILSVFGRIIRILYFKADPDPRIRKLGSVIRNYRSRSQTPIITEQPDPERCMKDSFTKNLCTCTQR